MAPSSAFRPSVFSGVDVVITGGKSIQTKLKIEMTKFKMRNYRKVVAQLD